MCGNYSRTRNTLLHRRPKKAVYLHCSKGLCNNYLEGGWKTRGGA